MKQCSHCHKEKSLSEFYPNKQNRDGRGPYCKPCHNLRAKIKRGTAHRVPATLPDGMKRCSKCKEVRLLMEFYKQAGRKFGVTSQCKSCHSKTQMASRPRQCGRKQTHRKWFLNYYYGLTTAQYEALLESQGFACAICKAALDDSSHIDHCHRTGAIRGVLCGRCNLAIGLLRDSPQFCEDAKLYLLKTVVVQQPK